MHQQENSIRTTSLVRSSSFVHFWGADALFDFARQSSVVVVPLIGAIALDATPFQMGVLAAAATSPSLLISLIAGVWVDRLPRRATMIVSALIRSLLAASVPLLWWAGFLNVWILAGLTVLSGATAVFFDLSRIAWLPALVGRSNLADANGKMNASTSTAQMIGPTIGGAAASAFSAPLAMLVDAPSALVSAVLTRRIPETSSSADRRQGNGRLVTQVVDGLRFSLQNPILRATIGASGLTSLFGHIFLAVYVLYMATYLELTSFAIGVVFGIGGFGALIGSFLAAPLARRYGIGPTITAGWLMFGLGGLPIPLAFLVPEYALWLVVFSEFFQWMVLPIAEVNQLSVRQAITPDSHLGRVAASYQFFVSGLIPIGALIGGTLGTLIGLPATLLIGVFGMLTAFVWTSNSALRSLRKLPISLAERYGGPPDRTDSVAIG
jgi:MFS family permease